MHKNRTKPKILYKIAKDPCIGKNAYAWVFLFIFSAHLPRSPPFRFRSTTRNDKKEDAKMNINQKEIGQRIAKIRLENGLTQEKLARTLNISTEHLGRIETGKRSVSVELLADLSFYFNVSTDYILLGKFVKPNEIKLSLRKIICNLSEIENNIK